MTKDLILTVLQPLAKAGATVDQPAAYKFEITYEDGTEKTILVGWNQIQMVLDKTINYMEVKSNGMVVYQYADGDTFSGSPIADAEAAYASLEAQMAN
jgi:hypothetical protein